MAKYGEIMKTLGKTSKTCISMESAKKVWKEGGSPPLYGPFPSPLRHRGGLGTFLLQRPPPRDFSVRRSATLSLGALQSTNEFEIVQLLVCLSVQ